MQQGFKGKDIALKLKELQNKTINKLCSQIKANNNL